MLKARQMIFKGGDDALLLFQTEAILQEARNCSWEDAIE